MKKNGTKFGSDFAKVDGHVIQPHEYDEIPELTDDMLARGTWKKNGRPVGRPKLENPKRALNLRVDGKVEEAYRATGPGWQTLMNTALTEYARAHGML